MNGSGVLERASLPSKINEKEKYQLKGRWMLQIESITNVGVGMEQRKEDHKNAEKDQRKMVIDLVDAEEEFSSSDEYDEIEDRGKRVLETNVENLSERRKAKGLGYRVSKHSRFEHCECGSKSIC